MVEDRNNTKQVTNLPKGWMRVKLGKIADIIMGQSPPSNTYNSDKNGLPFYQGKAEFGVLYPVPVRWCSKPKKIAEKNDILLSVRAPVGPTNICNETSSIGRGLAAIRYFVKDAYKFVFYYLRSIEAEIANNGIGSTFSAISKFHIENLTIPLPPLNEQKRIVEKIEELFTRLEAGVEALKKVKAQIKRYRQAVLKYAFEGKLTDEWRKQLKGPIEPASVLLERIKREHKEKLGKKYKELLPVDTSELPELPEGWVWLRVEDLIQKVSLTNKKLKQSEYKEEGLFPVIDQSKEYISGFSNREDLLIRYVKPLIVFGDHTKVVKYINFDFVPGADGIKVISVNDAFLSKLFFYFIQIIRLPEKGYARHFQFLEKSYIPVPSMIEQHKIVEEIERRFSVADEIEKVIDHSLKQAERLRQSILKRAFEGKLVPQDPSDEPAEKLLERIREEKEKLLEKNKKSKR